MVHQIQTVMQPRTYAADRAWSDAYLPAYRLIVATYLIVPAPFLMDTRRATDLTTITGGGLEVACRVRGYNYAARYGDEFTIRDQRTSGAETEMSKIMRGFGTHIVYGFSHPERPGKLSAWLLGDLSIFRQWIGRAHMQRGILPGALGPMQSDGTQFRAFRIDDLPPAFVIARKPYPIAAAA